MSKSTERHAREAAGKAAAAVGISRETLRRVKKLKELGRDDLAAAVQAGTLSLNAAYTEAIGDDRVALYIKLDPATDRLLREAAERNGMSHGELARMLIRYMLPLDDDTFFDDGSEA